VLRDRVEILVVKPEPPLPETRVRLTADRQRVNVGEPVTLTAIVDPSPPVPVQYRFRFGDQSNPIRTTRSSVEHVFAAPGNYTIEVQAVLERAGTAARARVISDRIEVQVIKPEPPPNIEVRLTAARQRVNVGEPVMFTATVSPSPPASVLYIFGFGDETGPVRTSRDSVEHVFAAPGDYSVRVEISSEGVSLAGNSLDIQVLEPGAVEVPPTGPNGDDDLPWRLLVILVIAAVVLGGAYLLWRRRSPKLPDSGSREAALHPPGLHYIPHSDPGVQNIGTTDTVKPLARHVAIRTVLDGGRQELGVDGALTLEERRAK
jgi:hypothetical protein